VMEKRADEERRRTEDALMGVNTHSTSRIYTRFGSVEEGRLGGALGRSGWHWVERDAMDRISHLSGRQSRGGVTFRGGESRRWTMEDGRKRGRDTRTASSVQ
jgi:hypothetical protein